MPTLTIQTRLIHPHAFALHTDTGHIQTATMPQTLPARHTRAASINKTAEAKNHTRRHTESLAALTHTQKTPAPHTRTPPNTTMHLVAGLITKHALELREPTNAMSAEHVLSTAIHLVTTGLPARQTNFSPGHKTRTTGDSNTAQLHAAAGLAQANNSPTFAPRARKLHQLRTARKLCFQHTAILAATR